MSKRYSRLPKGYDGSGITTTHSLGELLPQVLDKIGRHYQLRPDLVMNAWPDIIGPKLAPMTRAVSFADGVLVVKVKTSTLYSLLCRYDKGPLLRLVRQKFPSLAITDILFRMG